MQNKTHFLKILPCYFQSVIELKKPFEIRFNDRNFQLGDIVYLNEWENETYSGRKCKVVITQIFDISFIASGYVAFTFDLLEMEV